MTFFHRLGQFVSRVFEIRQAPPDLFERAPEPRRRGITTFICPKCRREFRAGADLFGHRCVGKAS